MTTHVERPLEHHPRAIIIGASSGIGAELVRELARHGYHVAAIARREALLTELRDTTNRFVDAERVTIYPHDVTKYDTIPTLFQRIVGELGGVDLVVYVSGIMPPVAIDEYDFSKDSAMIEVNVLGAIAWLNQAAQRFERAGSGHIVGISSIAGDRGRVGAPVYNTSKAALTTYLEALRNRLSRHGVTVTTIKPGMVETDILTHVDKKMWPISAPQAAQSIYKAIQRRRQTVYIPARWRLVALVIQHIPSILFRRLSI